MGLPFISVVCSKLNFLYFYYSTYRLLAPDPSKCSDLLFTLFSAIRLLHKAILERPLKCPAMSLRNLSPMMSFQHWFQFWNSDKIAGSHVWRVERLEKINHLIFGTKSGLLWWLYHELSPHNSDYFWVLKSQPLLEVFWVRLHAPHPWFSEWECRQLWSSHLQLTDDQFWIR